jgi:hypothetical protein
MMMSDTNTTSGAALDHIANHEQLFYRGVELENKRAGLMTAGDAGSGPQTIRTCAS